MTKIKILFVLFIMIGVSILFGYHCLFKRNAHKALANEAVLKLPDLNDVVITYIILCMIIIFALAMKKVDDQFSITSSTCIKEVYIIEDINYDYEFCINQYNNIVFKDQKNAMKTILEQHDTLIKKLEAERTKVSTDRLDNIYYSLQNNQSSKQEKELYILLSIYRNFYETQYNKTAIKGVK